MKHLLLCLLLTPAALVAASFEGKVSFEMTSSRGQPQHIVYNIKGDKMRIDMPDQQKMGGIIMDMTKRESMVLLDQQKMYMVMAMPDVASMAEKKMGEVKLEKTDETEKIAGYTATKYNAIAKDSTTELWLAEGLGTFMSFSQGNPMTGGKSASPAAAEWERALAGKELFPLRVVSKDKTGKESFRMEATAIDKTTLDESMFAAPDGYRKFDMGGMMRGVMPGLFPGSKN